MKEKRTLAILDSDLFPFFSSFNKKYKEEKTLDECIETCDGFINTVLLKTNASRFTGFITKGKCFRYSVFPEYKSNRKYTNPMKHSFDVRDYMIKRYGFVSLEGYEADDLCISLRKQLKDEYNCVVVSGDKDLLNLEGVNFNVRTHELFTKTKEDEMNFFWRQMIHGDTGDFVKCLPNHGPVAANTLLDNELIENYRSVVLNKYCEIYGEDIGITNFYINYKCLHIIDNLEVTNYHINKTKDFIISEQKK